MKITVNLILFLLISFTSIGQESSIKLKKGDTLHREIRLSFNNAAVAGNEYLIFKVNDDFDFNNLTLLINGKENNNGIIKIYANKRNNVLKIDVLFKKEANSGKYNFTLELINSSNKLKNSNIQFKGKKHFSNLEIELAKTSFERYIWYGIYFLLIIGVFFLVKFILTRNDMPFGKITFKNGTIIPIDGNVTRVDLSKLTEYSLKDAFGESINIKLIPADNKYKGKRKRFAKMRFGFDLDVKVTEYDGSVSSISSGYKLFHHDEVAIKKDNKVYQFKYKNSNVKK